MRFRTLVLFAVLLAVLVSLGTPPAAAQQTQKRSEVELWPVGPPEEVSYRPWDPYNLSVMLEVGGQVADVSGNRDVYETHQNYRDGFKVFSFNLRGEGKDAGAFLTDFYVQGGGWGNEPYSWVKFGFSKDKVFDFRGQFRESEYRFYFPLGRTFARNLHRDWTDRRFQDYDFTIFPKQKFRVKLGYSRNSTFGPTFTTADYDRDVLLLFEPVRQTYDEYTIGAEYNIQRWLFLGQYGYRFFRNDRCMDNPDQVCTFESVFDPATGIRNQGENLPTSVRGADGSAADIFRRAYPARGKVPFLRLNVVGRPHRTLEVSAGVTYSRAKYQFTFDQNIVGHDRFLPPSGDPADVTNFFERIEAFGSNRRPFTTFDANITWRPLPRLTITNNFQFRGYTQTGFIDEVITEDAGPPEEEFISTIISLDTYFDRIEGRYDFTNWLGVRGGFSFTKRDYEFFEYEVEDGTIHFEQECVDEFDVQAEHCETNNYTNRSLLYGVDLRLNRRAQFFFDAEIGNYQGVFTRVSPANIERYRLRGRFQPWDGIKLNASWFIFDTSNFNLPTRNPVFIEDCVTSGGNPAVFPVGDPQFPITCGDGINVASVPPEFLPGRHTTRNRGFAVDFQLTRWERGYLNLGYSRNDITSITDILHRIERGVGTDWYFRPTTEYILDDNYAYIDFGGRIAGNLYGELGYRVVFDTGTFPPSDPSDTCTVQTYLAANAGTITPEEGCPDVIIGFPFDPADDPIPGDTADRLVSGASFIAGSTGYTRGGLNYHQPHASLRYSFNDNITWKAGWRWYGYNVKQGTFSDYKSHIVTTSVVLSF